MHPRTLQLLSQTLWYGARLAPMLDETYLRNEFQASMEELIRTAASGQDARALFRAGRQVHRILERIHASGMVRLEELLLAERHVLLLLVDLRSSRDSGTAVPRSRRATPESSDQVGERAVHEPVSDTATIVLGTLKKGESVRAKDVIQRCTKLSDRTVKRCLKELVTAGLVRREQRDGIVLYRTSESSQ